MNEKQKKKRDFRSSKKWKAFRKAKMLEQGNKCFLSGRKLTGRWQCHHRKHSTPEAERLYENLENPNDFICLNQSQHELLHTLIFGYLHYGEEDYLNRVLDEVHFELDLMKKV